MKIYTVAYKTGNRDDNGDMIYEIVQPERAWSDKLAASRALRAMGGGKHGDNELVLYSYQLDEDTPEQELEQEFYVTIAVMGKDYDHALSRLVIQ